MSDADPLTTPDGVPLQYLLANEIREQICALADVDPEGRFGARESMGLRKHHLVAIAEVLEAPLDDEHQPATARDGEADAFSRDVPSMPGVTPAAATQDGYAALTLAELYRVVCRAADVEYNENAGHQWSLRRTQLKAIYRALQEQEREQALR